MSLTGACTVVSSAQSSWLQFAALKQQQSSQEIICEACNVPASTFGQSPNGQSKVHCHDISSVV